MADESNPDPILLARENIKCAEGRNCRPALKLYPDTEGKLTIGYGRNIEDNGISAAIAEQMLSEDIIVAVADAKYIFGDAFDTASPRRQAALIEMAFNLGRLRLLNFTRMIGAVRIGDWAAAAYHAKDSKWYHQVTPKPPGRGDRICEMLQNG
jgi:lysozyme